MSGKGSPASGLIGPNAILQVGEALLSEGGAPLAKAVFARAGLSIMLADPPGRMVPQEQAAALHRAVIEHLPGGHAERILGDAGYRTANYVIANRIPMSAKVLIGGLPAVAAAPLLLSAIERNGWTFAGTGKVSTLNGRPWVVKIAANPIALPGCPWHRAVFERLFRRLVTPSAIARETDCCAQGAAICRFEIG